VERNALVTVAGLVRHRAHQQAARRTARGEDAVAAEAVLSQEIRRIDEVVEFLKSESNSGTREVAVVWWDKV
jgi:hypothetical protein